MLSLGLGLRRGGGAGAVLGPRYWRIHVDLVFGQYYAAGYRPMITEIEFRDSIGGTDLTASADAVEKSIAEADGNSDLRSHLAFDNSGSVANSWFRDQTPGDQTSWVGWDFGPAGANIVEVHMLCNYSAQPDRNGHPQAFRLQSADDTAGPWTDVLTVTGLSQWVNWEWRTFN